MNRDDKIFTPCHRGMTGSAIKRNLESKGYYNLITRTHSELDLTNQCKTNLFIIMKSNLLLIATMTRRCKNVVKTSHN